MATITPRKRADGSTSYRASIRLKKDGVIIHRETETFDKRSLANEWAKRREVELSAPGALAKARGGLSIGDLLKWYIKDYGGGFGRTKLATIKQLQGQAIAKVPASHVTSAMVIEHIQARRKQGAGPATALNDIIWLRVLYKAARPALGLDLDLSQIEDAAEFCRSQKLIARPIRRKRRPTKSELNKLTKFFESRDGRATIPMSDIMWFAVHSARREEEITQLRWSDNNARHHTGVVRDAKHPTMKEGNHRTFKYTKEAWEIVKRQPKTSEFIFPYNAKSISAAFTRTCHLLDIEDLRFHDLRHEATSRLFEAGYSIVQVQQFTLHESWSSLQIYTNLQPKDVKHR